MSDNITPTVTGTTRATAAISGGAPAASAPATPVASAVDFQSFLQLLTAQLRYQDPLAPIDSTQFVAQLAGFSTVEQLVNANRRLDEIAARLDAGAPVIDETPVP